MGQILAETLAKHKDFENAGFPSVLSSAKTHSPGDRAHGRPVSMLIGESQEVREREMAIRTMKPVVDSCLSSGVVIRRNHIAERDGYRKQL